MRSLRHHPASSTWPEVLDDLIETGLISTEQATAIEEHERAEGVVVPPAEAERGPSLVVEALGYLGGVVMLVGAGLLVGLVWPDLSTALRLLLLGATALGLVAAGYAVPERLGDAAVRLQSVLWAAAVGATAGFVTLFTSEVLDRQDEHALVVIGPVTAAVAATLWWQRRTWLQQLALLAPVLLTAAGVALELTSTDSSWAGAAVWMTALAWTGAALAGLVAPRPTGVAFGVVGAVLGASTMQAEVGIALALATAVAAVALALWERSLPWLGVGAAMVLWTMPRAADAWFPGRLSAALTLIATGAVLVVAAVWVARHQGSAAEEHRS